MRYSSLSSHLTTYFFSISPMQLAIKNDMRTQYFFCALTCTFTSSYLITMYINNAYCQFRLNWVQWTQIYKKKCKKKKLNKRTRFMVLQNDYMVQRVTRWLEWTCEITFFRLFCAVAKTHAHLCTEKGEIDIVKSCSFFSNKTYLRKQLGKWI